MAEVFFKWCPKCSRCYTSPDDWRKHLAEHEQESKQENAKLSAANAPKDPPEVAQAKREAANVPNADPKLEEEDRLARVKKLRVIKRKLKAAGIECATMTEEETMREWEAALKAGKVSE